MESSFCVINVLSSSGDAPRVYGSHCLSRSLVTPSKRCTQARHYLPPIIIFLQSFRKPRYHWHAVASLRLEAERMLRGNRACHSLSLTLRVPLLNQTSGVPRRRRKHGSGQPRLPGGGFVFGARARIHEGSLRWVSRSAPTTGMAKRSRTARYDRVKQLSAGLTR